MQVTLIMIFEAMILALSCSIDAFAASFAYGSGNIKIPMASVMIINIISSSILGVSLFLGALVRQYMSDGLTAAVCFVMLLLIGIVKLLDGVTKSIIRKHNSINKEVKFSMFNFNFIINLYADPEKADVDASKTISPTEAASLAIALSLDGLAAGFGAALGNVNGLAVFLVSLVINMVAIISGGRLGSRLARSSSVELSWLSGVILIALAVMKLF